MPLECCPVSDCINPLPKDGLVCVDCYFLLERAEFRLLINTRHAADRAQGDDRQHLQSQFKGYLKSACGRIEVRREKRNA